MTRPRTWTAFRTGKRFGNVLTDGRDGHEDLYYTRDAGGKPSGDCKSELVVDVFLVGSSIVNGRNGSHNFFLVD